MSLADSPTGTTPATVAARTNGVGTFSQALADLLVYTVGVEYRGFNKKEHYSVEHMFSLSGRKADKLLKGISVYDVGPGGSQQKKQYGHRLRRHARSHQT